MTQRNTRAKQTVYLCDQILTAQKGPQVVVPRGVLSDAADAIISTKAEVTACDLALHHSQHQTFAEERRADLWRTIFIGETVAISAFGILAFLVL